VELATKRSDNVDNTNVEPVSTSSLWARVWFNDIILDLNSADFLNDRKDGWMPASVLINNLLVAAISHDEYAAAC
jgi:hypothetical protein